MVLLIGSCVVSINTGPYAQTAACVSTSSALDSQIQWVCDRMWSRKSYLQKTSDWGCTQRTPPRSWDSSGTRQALCAGFRYTCELGCDALAPPCHCFNLCHSQILGIKPSHQLSTPFPWLSPCLAFAQPTPKENSLGVTYLTNGTVCLHIRHLQCHSSWLGHNLCCTLGSIPLCHFLSWSLQWTTVRLAKHPGLHGIWPCWIQPTQWDYPGLVSVPMSCLSESLHYLFLPVTSGMISE